MKLQTSARFDVPTLPTFFALLTEESKTGVQVFFFKRKLGYVHDGQPTERHEKVNAWRCARRTVDRDLVSVIADKKERKFEKIVQDNNANLNQSFFLNK